MIKWLKRFVKNWNAIEQESVRAGIIHCFNPYTGVSTHIDQETYKKYIHDKQRAIRESNSDTKS